MEIDRFIKAISGAVVEAQNSVQQQHLGTLWQFFHEGAPVSVELNLPRVDPATGQQAPVKVSVPLMTLVNHAQLGIEEMQVTMQVDMSETSPPPGAEGKVASGPSPAPGWRAPEYHPVLGVATTTGKQPGAPGMANVTLSIKAAETPEGLARLLEHLNKSL